MEAQLSFFGQPKRRPAAMPVPKRAARSIVIYFAILPPKDVCRAIVRLRQEIVARERIFGRPVAPERLHISLAPLLRCSPSSVPDSETKANDIAAGVTMSAFDVIFDRVLTFSSKDHDEAHRCHYLILDGTDLPGLTRLNGLFRRAFVRCGLTPAMPNAFHPHLTLYYANRPIAPRDVPPIHWTVRDIALVRSGEGRYEVLKRWRLQPR